MRKLPLALALLLAPLTAFASPTTITGNYTVQYTPTVGNGPDIQNLLSNPFTLSLTPGVPTSVTNFLSVSPAGRCGWCGYHNTARGTISVTFNFSAPGSGTASDSADYFANYFNETDAVTWHNPDPIAVDFADGSVLDVNLIDASDWTIYPKIDFDLVKGPSPVPEAPSLALLGGGLLCLMFVLRRRTRCKPVQAA